MSKSLTGRIVTYIAYIFSFDPRYDMGFDNGVSAIYTHAVAIMWGRFSSGLQTVDDGGPHSFCAHR